MNDFGVIRANGLVKLRTAGDIGNRCGVIYSECGTDISGRNLYNGYAESKVSMDGGVNPNAPIYDKGAKKETVKVKDATRVLVSAGYWARTGRRHAWGLGSRREEWHPPVYKDIPAEYKNIAHDVIIGFQQYGTLYASASASPGFIFVDKIHGGGNLTLNMTGNIYSGVTVAAGNIFYKGQQLTGTRTVGESGKIIAGGNVQATLRSYAFKDMVMQAMDILLSQVEDFNFGEGYYKGKDEGKPKETGTQVINLRRFLEQTSGLLTKPASEGSVYKQVPWKYGPGISLTMVYTMPSNDVGYTFGPNPKTSGFSRIFPTVQPQTIIQSLNYILTSLYGNRILLSLDIRSELEDSGKKYAATHSTHDIVLGEDDSPMILYDWAGHQTQTLVNTQTGENTLIAAVDPILICAMYSKMADSLMQANRYLQMKTRGNATFRTGVDEFEAPIVKVEADEELFVRGTLGRDVTTGKDEYRPTFLATEESLELQGKLGVTIEGSVVSSKQLTTHSELGDDRRIAADGYDRHWVEDGVFYTSTTKHPTQIVAGTYSSSAPHGTSLDVGTHMKVGEFEVSGKHYESQSSREEVKRSYDKSTSRIKVEEGTVETEKLTPTVIEATRKIHFSTSTASLRGTKLVTPDGEIVDDTSHMEMVGDIGKSTEYHHRSKKSFFRRSDFKAWVDREFLEPTEIVSKSFKLEGKGDLVLKSVRAKIGEMTVAKDLHEGTQHLSSKTRIVSKSSGFFGPRLKIDPMVDSFKGLAHIRVDGDAIPTLANVVGSSAQTVAHSKILANLSVIGNPGANLLNIGLGRFVVGPAFGKSKQTLTVTESKAIPSSLDVGILRISNDRTHMEGMWKVGNGYIDTGKLETVAPKSTVRRESKSSGWRITLGSAIFSAVLGMNNPINALPSIGVMHSENVSYQERYEPVGLSADQLIIKVNDALFSGFQVRSKILEPTSTGQVTVESLRNMFESHSKNESFNTCLAALASCIKEVPVSPSFIDPRLTALPSIRIAKQEILEETIDRLAGVVGTERFYAKITGVLYQRSAEFGLFRDSYAVPTGSENIEGAQRFKEDITLRSKHKTHVINPGIAEVFGAFTQVESAINTIKEVNKLKAHYVMERQLQGIKTEIALAEAKEIDEKTISEIQETKRKVIENRQKTQEKIQKIIPEQKVSEDSLENLYATIYADEITPKQLLAFIDEVKTSEAREQQLITTQKAKIAANKSLGAKVRQLLNNYVDTQIAECEVDQEVNMAMFRATVPVVPSIFDAAASYASGALSGNEAAMEGLRGVAADIATMAAFGYIGKGVVAGVKTGGRLALKALSRTPATNAQLEKLGLKIARENFKVDWKNPDVTQRGLQYEDFVAKEVSEQGFARLAPNTNTFDAFNPISGHALSIKSLDTQTPARLADPRQIEHLLDAYVRKTKNFRGIKPTQAQKLPVMKGDVQVSEIRVGVPKETTMEQWLAMQRSAIKAEQQGAKITFGVGK